MNAAQWLGRLVCLGVDLGDCSSKARPALASSTRSLACRLYIRGRLEVRPWPLGASSAAVAPTALVALVTSRDLRGTHSSPDHPRTRPPLLDHFPRRLGLWPQRPANPRRRRPHPHPHPHPHPPLHLHHRLRGRRPLRHGQHGLVSCVRKLARLRLPRTLHPRPRSHPPTARQVRPTC